MLTRFFSASLTMPIVTPIVTPIAPPMVTPISLLSIHLFIILAMMTTTSASRAAGYIEPDYTTELFQLEKIPLPQHRMQQLGKSLVIVALRKHDGSPIQQQATARLLLLAMQLDPQNKRPQEISQALVTGKNPPASADHLITKCTADIQNLQSLLSKPQARAEANQLALYMKDACKTLRPDGAKHQDGADWKGVLPALTAYKTPIKNIPQAHIKTNKASPPAPKPTQPKKSTPHFHLVKQSIQLPIPIPITIEKKNEDLEALLSDDQDSDQDPEKIEEQETTEAGEVVKAMTLASMTLKLSPCKAEEATTPFISILHSDVPMLELDQLLKQLIKDRHSILPHFKGVINFPDGSHGMGNQLAIAGPLALMLEGSLANSPLRDDLCLLADINAKGDVIEPDNFWQLLTALRQVSHGGRLIVSAESAEIMQQLLVYKEPDFFTRWEVLSVTDIDQALAAAILQSSADLGKASELFASFQDLSSKKTVTQLAADHDIRPALDEMVKLAPEHLSAKMLLLQGGGKRPIHLSERALRLELRPLIDELNRVLQFQTEQPDKETEQPDSDELEKTHEQIGVKLEQLEPFVSRDDDPIYEDTLELAKDFKKLASLRERMQNRYNNESAREKAKLLFKDMKNQGAALAERISAPIEADIGPEPSDKKE